MRVLLGVKDFEQRGGGIAAEVPADLVNLVQHEHRVAGLSAPDALDHLSGQRSDVGAPVPADLGLVVNAAQGHAHELAVERARDRLGERSLPHARRSYEADDGSFDLGLEPQHGQVVEDAFLDLVEVVVVLVQDRLGFVEVDFQLADLAPGQDHQPVEVGPRDVVIDRGGRHLGQPVQLAERFLARLFRHAGGLNLPPECIDLLRAVVGVAQLLLDRLHLLAQVVLALSLRHLGLDFRLDLRPELQNLGLLRESGHEPLQALGDSDGLEQLLPEGRRKCRQRPGDQVRERARPFRGAEDARKLVGQRRGERDDLLEEAGSRPRERFDLEGRRGRLVGKTLNPRPEKRGLLDGVGDTEPHKPLNDEAQGAVGLLQRLLDDGRGPDRVKPLSTGRVLRRIALHDGADDSAALERLLDEPDRRGPADRERHHRLRKDHRPAQRQNCEGIRNNELAIVALASHDSPFSSY